MSDDLDNLQGPRELREHAKGLRRDLTAEKERADTLERELNGYKRRDAFEAAREELPVELWENLDLEDLGEIPAEAITIELLEAKAGERAAQRAELFEAQAKELGISSDELQSGLRQYAAQKAQEKADRTAATIIAAGGQAMPPSETPNESASKAYQRARERGAPQDDAEAEWVRASAEAQTGKGR